MHEFSLVDELLRQVESLRLAHAAHRVVAIHVRIGELAGVEPELFRSAFACLAPAVNLDVTALHVQEIALEAECRACAARFRVERFCFVCPVCECQELTVVQGESVVLESVELERESTGSPPAQDAGRQLVRADP